MKAIAENARSNRRLGQGEFPPELDRVNWGAVLLGTLWSFVYGVWPWFFGLLAFKICSRVFFHYFPASSWGDSWIVDLAVSVPLGLVFWCALAVLGLRANRLVWHREQAKAVRERTTSVPRPAATVPQYIKAQRTWAVWGVLLMIVGAVLDCQAVISTLPNRVLPALIGCACSLAVLAALFVYDRTRHVIRPPC